MYLERTYKRYVFIRHTHFASLDCHAYARNDKIVGHPHPNGHSFRAFLYTECATSKTEHEPQGDDRSLSRQSSCVIPRSEATWESPNRNKNRLTIATNRISPRAYYRTENLYYQFEQGQELLPQLRQIICLVKVGRDTHTRLNYILPLVIPSNAEESRRKPHFATLDSSLRSDGDMGATR